MAFPVTPSNGQKVTVNNVTYQYDPTKNAWFRIVTTGNTVTLGNLVVTSNITSNVISAQGYYWANGTPFTSSSYGNTDVAAYLLVNSTITGLQSNAAFQANLLDVLTGNAASQGSLLDILVANAAVQSANLTYLLSNAAAQEASLTSLVSNAAAQSGALDSINANVGSFYTWANLTYGTSSYANANVAGYLVSYTGNLSAGNITLTGNIVAGGVRATTSATAPANPTPGDIWYSTTDQTTLRYTYDGTTRFWLDIGGPSLSTNIANLDTVISQSVPVVSLNANVNAANAAIITANNAVVSYVNTLNSAMIGNVNAANSAIVTANTGLKSYTDALNTAMIGNVTAANAAIVTANSAVVSYVNTLNTAMAANVAAANAAIITANTGLKSYVDAQDSLKSPTASPTFTGTVTAPILSITGNATVSGNILQQQAYYETYGNITNTGGNLTCNFNLGSVFYVTSLTSNATANFTNVNALTNSVTATTMIIDQGATAYRISNIQINGVNQIIKWIGTTVHTGTASNTDIVSFSLIHLGGGVYRVLGQSSSYG